jgi:hypothetical protein
MYDDVAVPMITISNAERAEMPTLRDTVVCYHCGQPHTVVYGKHQRQGGEWEQETAATHSLAFFKCPVTGQTYLAGVNGKTWTPTWKPKT